MNFDAAFELVIGHEGGYVDNPADPGGETKFGISKRSHPGENIQNLTLERAKQVYLKEYWGPAGCDAVPGTLKLSLFDYAVNSGPKEAVKALQRLVREFPDGIIGPKTLGAIDSWDIRNLAILFDLSRLEMMTSLPGWETFGKGWTRRMIKNLRLHVERNE